MYMYLLLVISKFFFLVGIYIPSSNTDVPCEFRGIGIRIEDDVLITNDGPLNLSVKCPKDPDEIEMLINTHV